MLGATCGLPLMRGMAYSLRKRLPPLLPLRRDGGCVGLKPVCVEQAHPATSCSTNDVARVLCLYARDGLQPVEKAAPTPPGGGWGCAWAKRVCAEQAHPTASCSANYVARM